MKKYITQATKYLAILTLISAVILVVGIILFVAGSYDIALQVGLTVSGGLLTIIFLVCFFAEKSRSLIIDGDRIIFPRGAEKNEKIIFRKTTIMIDEISSIESRFFKGDKFISGDCFFYTLKLKTGTKVTVTLYAFGKKSEKEILETIQKSIL